MSTITLKYDVNPGNRPLATSLPKVAAIQLNKGELDLLNMTILNDVSAQNGSKIRRTVTLHHDDTLFTTDDARKDATRNLYSATLSAGFPGSVEALEPEIS